MPHTKPTAQELEANIEKINAELDSEATEKVKEVEEIVEEAPAEEVVKEVKKETLKEEVVVEEVKPIDYQNKFSESTREAQVLYAKNKKTNEILEKASALPEPTEDELTHQYKDWDVMSDFEKTMAKEAFIGARYRKFISDGTKEFKDIDAWGEGVEKFTDNPETLIKYPQLEGKTEAFKDFALKPTRRGVDFNDLVAAFSYQVTQDVKPKSKGAMFEKGTGGHAEVAPKSDKLSPEQGRTLRETNYDKWKEMLRAGKISSE